MADEMEEVGPAENGVGGFWPDAEPIQSVQQLSHRFDLRSRTKRSASSAKPQNVTINFRGISIDQLHDGSIVGTHDHAKRMRKEIGRYILHTALQISLERAKIEALTHAREVRLALLVRKTARNDTSVRTQVCSMCAVEPDDPEELRSCQRKIPGGPPSWSGRRKKSVTLAEHWRSARAAAFRWTNEREMFSPFEPFESTVQILRMQRLNGVFNVLYFNWQKHPLQDAFDTWVVKRKLSFDPYYEGELDMHNYYYELHPEGIVEVDFAFPTQAYIAVTQECGTNICDLCRMEYCGVTDVDDMSFCVPCFAPAKAEYQAKIERIKALREASKEYYAQRGPVRVIFCESPPLPSSLVSGQLTAGAYAQLIGRTPLNGHFFSQSEFNGFTKVIPNPEYGTCASFQDKWKIVKDTDERPWDLSVVECRSHYNDRTYQTVLKFCYEDKAGRFRMHGVADVEFPEHDDDEADRDLHDEHDEC